MDELDIALEEAFLLEQIDMRADYAAYVGAYFIEYSPKYDLVYA